MNIMIFLESYTLKDHNGGMMKLKHIKRVLSVFPKIKPKNEIEKNYSNFYFSLFAFKKDKFLLLLKKVLEKKIYKSKETFHIL